MEDKLFFVGQKAFIEKNGEILVLITKDLGVDLPGGKIQEGEDDLDESLKREVKEETNLEIEVGDIFIRWSFKLRYGHNIGKKVFLVGFRCKYKSGEIKIGDEHSGYKWVNKDNYKELNDGSEHFKALEKYFN
jgi:8-oxo-dGTP pyrophosphatase MutT (NUDIX family)